MRLPNSRSPRSATHLLECAIVYPLVFFILFAIFAGGVGVSNYQQVAHLSREAARYASTHAGQYATENAAAITAGTLPTVDQSYITNNIVLPEAYMLNSANLTVQIYVYTSSSSQGTAWDTAMANGANWPNSATTVSETSYMATNTVAVTVSYQWQPAFFLTGLITLQSTSVMPISY